MTVHILQCSNTHASQIVKHFLPSVTTPYHPYHRYRSTMFLRGHHQANTYASRMVKHLLPSITTPYHPTFVPSVPSTMIFRGHYRAITHASRMVKHPLPSVTTPYHQYHRYQWTMFLRGHHRAITHASHMVVLSYQWLLYPTICKFDLLP